MNVGGQLAWLDFAEAAWNAAGRPQGLRPHLIETDPIRYDTSYYGYFEQRFFDYWLSLSQNLDPDDGMFLRSEHLAFRASWKKYYDWRTIWKQVLPLFAFGAALGVDGAALVQFASYYSLAQAIPSVVTDKVLDSEDVPSTTDSAFCTLAYIKGLCGIRALQGESTATIEGCFLELTREMYESMLAEHLRRYILPSPPISNAINDHCAPASRLHSSIFFEVLPRWAYALAGKEIPNAIAASFKSLRMVRQINDELSDIYIDLPRGLLTLPWLYALDEASGMRSLIEALWQEPNNPRALAACQTCLRV
jgi:hypothetical protein